MAVCPQFAPWTWVWFVCVWQSVILFAPKLGCVKNYYSRIVNIWRRKINNSLKIHYFLFWYNVADCKDGLRLSGALVNDGAAKACWCCLPVKPYWICHLVTSYRCSMLIFRLPKQSRTIPKNRPAIFLLVVCCSCLCLFCCALFCGGRDWIWLGLLRRCLGWCLCWFELFGSCWFPCEWMMWLWQPENEWSELMVKQIFRLPYGAWQSHTPYIGYLFAFFGGSFVYGGEAVGNVLVQ